MKVTAYCQVCSNAKVLMIDDIKFKNVISTFKIF